MEMVIQAVVKFYTVVHFNQSTCRVSGYLYKEILLNKLNFIWIHVSSWQKVAIRLKKDDLEEGENATWVSVFGWNIFHGALLQEARLSDLVSSQFILAAFYTVEMAKPRNKFSIFTFLCSDDRYEHDFMKNVVNVHWKSDKFPFGIVNFMGENVVTLRKAKEIKMSFPEMW